MKTKKQMVAFILLILTTTGLLKATAPLPAKIAMDSEEYLTVAEINERCYYACRKDLLALTALVENFHEEPYFCGKRWTIGYGTTIYPNGEKVTKNDPKISKEYAQQCVYKHYDEQVLPWIKTYVKRELSRTQMLGLCSFLYNVGGENFSGFNRNGEKVTEPSKVLLAINNGENGFKTAVKMNGFRSSNGVLAKGLTKRHWLEGAIYLGLVKMTDVYSMQPSLLYKSDIDFYYESTQGDFWKHDYSEQKVQKFIENNITDTLKVRDII